VRNIHFLHNPFIICRYPVAAREFLPPGTNVRGVSPPTGNTHPYNKAYMNDKVTEQHSPTIVTS